MKGKYFLAMPFSFPALVLFILLFSACRQKTNSYEPTYSLDSSHKKTLSYGVPTQAYFQTYSPFVNYLNEHLQGIHIQIVASSDFSAYVKKVNNRQFDLAIANGILALDSNRLGYQLAGEAIGEEPNIGVILVNKDSAINKFSDLKGKSIASLESPALQGYMLPMVYLLKKGLNVNKDIKLKYLESFESVILNVYLGKCSAGFASIAGWRNFVKKRPELVSKVVVKWVTPPTAGNTLFIRNNLNEKTASQLKSIILEMHKNEHGRKALTDLGYAKFVPTDSNTYRPLRNFLKEYKELIVDPRY
jgi:phosphonate transport system substrate-binding protein